MSNKDTVIGTFKVAGLLSVVCAILVSFSAVTLRPTQAKNKALDKKKNILKAAGLLDESRGIEEVFSEKIKARLVDLDTGKYVEGQDALVYDQRKAAKDPKRSEKIPPSKDIANVKRIAEIATVYEVYDGDQLQRIVIPFHGKGLWSTMYGFLALTADTKTVVGLGYYEHAETPGLGGEISNEKWTAQFDGKKVYDDNWNIELTVLKGKVDPSSEDAKYQVDGLSGATLTTVGVRNSLHFWLGEQGFGKYLENIRSRGSLNG